MGKLCCVHHVDGVDELSGEFEADAEVGTVGVFLEDELPEAGGHPLRGNGFGGADDPSTCFRWQVTTDVRRELIHEADAPGACLVKNQPDGGGKENLLGLLSMEDVPRHFGFVEGFEDARG